MQISCTSLAAGDAGETAVASRARQGASDGGAAHRGLLLDEVDADTAACGVLERPLGLVVEAVALKTVNEEQSGYSERASLSAGADRTLRADSSASWLT